MMILVTGANGVVGQPLCKRLKADKVSFITASRSLENSNSNIIRWDLSQPANTVVEQQLTAVEVLLHCAPIWLLPRQLKTFHQASVMRLVVFSSTSVLSKQSSLDPQDKALVAQLANSEKQLWSYCNTHSMSLTILRPSMIYGYGRDQNVMQIARFIKRFGFMLLAGKAQGLRQPVHADDLVDATLAVMRWHSCIGKTYNLAGAEQLSYRAMVERIFTGLGVPIRIITIPLIFYRFGLSLATKFSRFSYNAEMANRMSQDLVYSCDSAHQDIEYEPQKFLTNPQRDLIV